MDYSINKELLDVVNYDPEIDDELGILDIDKDLLGDITVDFTKEEDNYNVALGFSEDINW